MSSGSIAAPPPWTKSSSQHIARAHMPVDEPDSPWFDVSRTLSALHNNYLRDYTNVVTGRDVRDLPDGWVEVNLTRKETQQARRHIRQE